MKLLPLVLIASGIFILSILGRNRRKKRAYSAPNWRRGKQVRTEKDVFRLWTANETLLRERIHPFVIQPLSGPPGLSTENEWDYILATSLGRCFDTFTAVQILSDPSKPQRLWIDAFVLSRSIFEASVTLQWCSKEAKNLERFLDDYHLRVARMLDSLPVSAQEEVRPERKQQIKEREAKVLKKYGCGPGKHSIMTGLEEMCRVLSAGQKEPNRIWEYNNYYREVSNFAHPTAWHLFSYRSKGTPITEVVPSADIGFRALLVSGGSFMRILEQWNQRFKRLKPELPYTWLREWESSFTGNGAAD